MDDAHETRSQKYLHEKKAKTKSQEKWSQWSSWRCWNDWMWFSFCFVCQYMFHWLIHLKCKCVLVLYLLREKRKKKTCRKSVLMKIEHVHYSRIAGFDLNFTIMVQRRFVWKLLPPQSPTHIKENEMHSQFNSLAESVYRSIHSAFDSSETTYSNWIAAKALNNFDCVRSLIQCEFLFAFGCFYRMRYIWNFNGFFLHCEICTFLWQFTHSACALSFVKVNPIAKCGCANI